MTSSAHVLPPDDQLAAVTSLFLSPHLDDIAFSCGGMAAMLAGRGEHVLIATCFTQGPQPGEPFSEAIRTVHRIWNIAGDEAIARFWDNRRAEDEAASAAIGARHFWLPYRDALYRGGQYYSADMITNHVRPGDWELFEQLSAHVLALWRRTPRAIVYMPMAIGNHVDHHLVFMLSGALRDAGAELWHYEDFPYVTREPALGLRLAALGAPYRARTVDVTDYIEARLAATASYASQMELTFGKLGPYRDVIVRYAAAVAASEGRCAERLWTLDRLP